MYIAGTADYLVDADKLRAMPEGGSRDILLPATLSRGKRFPRERRLLGVIVVVGRARSDAARMRWFAYSLQLPCIRCSRTGKYS